MEKVRRFKTGVLGSVFFHFLLFIVLGISLSLYTAYVPKKSNKILEVSLVSGGGNSAGRKINVAETKKEEKKEMTQSILDSIVEKKENIKEESMQPSTKSELQQNEQNSSSTKDASVNSGNSSGSGEGKGGGAGQGDDTGSGEPVQPPRLVSRVQPDYPSVARQNSVEGTTYVRLLVNASGDVESVSVANSSGSGVLDNAAVEAAYNWGFVPAKDEGGRAVNCYVRMPIAFKLR